jgi:hypothetical protein
VLPARLSARSTATYGRAVLADGRYDVFVVDAVAEGASALRVDVTILGGEHNGDVISVRAEGFAIDEVEALGLPGTLTVEDGEPTLVLEH